MIEQHVAVAIVVDKKKEFLVCFNEKWRGYAFPMQKLPLGAPIVPGAGIRALQSSLGEVFPNADEKPLEYLGAPGKSGRTDELKAYAYHVFEVNPRVALSAGSLGSRYGFLSYNALRATDNLVTWSTKRIAEGLIENQQVAIAVISRQGASGKEFLLVWNANYGGFFFPASRIKTDVKPDVAALDAVRWDTEYWGAVHTPRVNGTEDQHPSRRFNKRRNYVFHICRAEFPSQLDLTAANNPLERSLIGCGKRFNWFREDELAQGAKLSLSPTVEPLRLYVIAAAG